MCKNTSQKQKAYKIFSIAIILIGVILITYMMKIEDEPGALPLFLIVIGISWFITNQIKIRNQRIKNKK